MQDGQFRYKAVGRPVTGTGASAIKYDILTALLVLATRGDAVESRLSLRLSLLITARYSWRAGTFAVGQREMARMWGVTERTAKREVARMRAMGWIDLRVPAARGRVAEHAIDLGAVIEATRAHWDAVGPDFAARMGGAGEASSSEPQDNVVPFHLAAVPPAPDATPTADPTGWSAAAAALHAADPHLYGAWFARLHPLELEGGVLTLVAPSSFIASYVETHHRSRLATALVANGTPVRDVRILGPRAGNG